MAEKYSFFNAEQNSAGEYDRTYLAEDIAAYFASFVGTGIYAKSADNLKVYQFEGMNIQVKAGKGWINGYYYENDSDLSLTLDNADGTQGRIDSVVLRLDLTNRYIKVFVKKGVLSANPIAPQLTRNADIWELQLAAIQVSAGAAEITDSNITDTRMNSELCGVVKGVIEEIDTSNLFSQYNNEFNTWFDTIKDQLTSDAAGKLQAQITDIVNGDIVPASGINTYVHVPKKKASKEGELPLNFPSSGTSEWVTITGNYQQPLQKGKYYLQISTTANYSYLDKVEIVDSAQNKITVEAEKGWFLSGGGYSSGDGNFSTVSGGQCVRFYEGEKITLVLEFELTKETETYDFKMFVGSINSGNFSYTLEIYKQTENTIHNIYGTGSNGRVKLLENVKEGDSFTVNGQPVTAYMGAEEAISSMAGNDWNGKWISFIYDKENQNLNFKGGGGGKVTVSGLSANKILNDTTVTITQGNKIISSVKGNITQQGQKIVVANTQNQQFGPGIYLSGPLVVSGDPSLVASNIRKGATIFGVAGTADYSGSCVAPTIMAHCALGQYTSDTGFLTFFPLGFVSDGSFSISGNKLICNVAGTYNIQCSVQKKNLWTFAYGVDLRLNGSNIDTDPIASSFQRTLNKGDYFQFYYHVSTDENGTNAAAVACLKIDRI